MVENFDEKWNYNNNLNRFYNGCNYITENPEQFDNYIDKVMALKHNCEVFLSRIEKKQKVTEDEILNGFNLSEEGM